MDHQYTVGAEQSESLCAMDFAVQPRNVEQAVVLACVKDETSRWIREDYATGNSNGLRKVSFPR